jgi:hypothetical protein
MRRTNGRFHNYTTADGLSSDRIITVYQDHGPGAGTEIELRVPGAVAYRSTVGGSRWERFLRTARGSLS